MKKNITKILLAAFSAAFIAVNLSSCTKSDSTATGSITESDAVQVTTDAVTPSTGGMVSQVNSAAGLFSNATVTGGTVSVINNRPRAIVNIIPCGSEKDSTIAYASVAGAVPSFSYSLTWKYTLACTVPSTLTLNFNGSGSYNGSALSSTFTSTGGFVLSGLAAANPQYTYNANYSRAGVITSKVGDKNTFNHSLTITSSNILYDKASQEIVSGTATVAVKITSSSGNAYNYGGTLTFLGSKTATLVLNSGTVYHISW